MESYFKEGEKQAVYRTKNLAKWVKLDIIKGF